MPLMRFLMMFWVPKPMPMASAPPRKAKAVIGMRPIFSTTISTTSTSTELIQRRSTRASGGDRCRRRAARSMSLRDT